MGLCPADGTTTYVGQWRTWCRLADVAACAHGVAVPFTNITQRQADTDGSFAAGFAITVYFWLAVCGVAWLNACPAAWGCARV